MAKRYIVELVDDLDGTPLAQDATTLSFSLEGRDYEIDLSPENADRLREALAPFVEKARRISSIKAGRSRRAAGADHSAVRVWARANGHEIGERGRIPLSVVEAYERAQR